MTNRNPETNMMPKIISDMWDELPRNSALGIAKALLLPLIKGDVHGKSMWVGGNQIVELEDKILETQPLWMGSKMTEDVLEGNRRMLVLIPSPSDSTAGK